MSADRPPNTLPPTERGRATRQAILDAAEAVFDELTYDRASVSEITRRAGVAQGTFYLYFADKRSVFDELVRSLSRGLRHAISEVIYDEPDRIAAERRGFERFFEYINQHRSFYKLVGEAEFVDPALFRWHYERFAEGYIKGIGRAIEAGQIPGDIDAETLAFCLMGIGDFIGMRYVLWTDQGVPQGVFEDVFRFITRGLGAKVEP
jgi:AcrR family transcriptional regulator